MSGRKSEQSREDASRGHSNSEPERESIPARPLERTEVEI